MSVNKSSPKLKRQLVDIKKNIRKKLLALKLNKSDQDRQFNATYDAFINPLNKIANSYVPTNMQSIKSEKISISKMKQEEGESLIDHDNINTMQLSDSYDLDVAAQQLREKHKKSYLARTPQAQIIRDKSATTPEIQITEEHPVDLDESIFEDSHDPEITIPVNEAEGSRLEKIDPTVYEGYLSEFAPLPRSFLDLYLRDDRAKICDRKYGINVRKSTDQWVLGPTRVDLRGDDLVMNDEVFKGTPGLYELLFLKEPLHYTEDDTKVYAKMLKSSKAAYLNYDPNQRYKGNQSFKYKSIIKPSLGENRTKSTSTPKIIKPSLGANRSKSTSTPQSAATTSKHVAGFGNFDSQLNVENKPYRAIYWDDPNELVDRLWLLHASKRAGNNTHDNEIAAIEEELREENYIL